MSTAAPDAPVVDMQDWLEACEAPGVPFCKEVEEAHALGRDVVIVAE